MQVAIGAMVAMVVAVVVVDDDNGVKWWRWWGVLWQGQCSTVMAMDTAKRWQGTDGD